MSSAFACVIGHRCKDLCSRKFIFAGIALARSFAGTRMTTATVMLRRHFDCNEVVELAAPFLPNEVTRALIEHRHVVVEHPVVGAAWAKPD